MSYLPIEDHGIIGDLHTAALVGMDGTIDWLCLPSFDGPSVFASILDDEKGGHFKLAPAGDPGRSQQLYLPDTNILLTRFLSAEGVAETLDFMPLPEGQNDRHRLVRNVRVVRGKLPFEMECRPAFDYARQGHTVSVVKTGAVFRGPTALGLRSDVPLAEGPGGSVRAGFTLEAGESCTFVLANLADGEGPEDVDGGRPFEEYLEGTMQYWRRWISGCTYDGRWREDVYRSALALKIMVYHPTGALVAAPTMGLPEWVGGERNWDYRYTWLRDAAFALYALISVGFESEAKNFMGWLRERCHRDTDGLLQPLYGIDGRTEIEESVLNHLSGYKGSSPVRLGNAAYGQTQLDLYGAVLDAAYLYNKWGAPLDYDLWQNLRKILDWLADNWQRPDEGIWEVRGGSNQFVSSKLMAWVALERAGRISHQRGLPAGDGRWTRERDRIYEEIMEKGWNPKKGAFTQTYGGDALDASLLLMPLVKFVGPTDPRWISTLDHIQRELARDTLVDRYNVSEASPTAWARPPRGSFSMCSFWLVECLTKAGRLDEARLALEKMFSYANHLGLYAEEIGPSGEALGNFPQAFTHLSLISAAVHLDRALGSR
ncbi:glycoside hydrolase family 15 protein [Rubrobacter marinus]|uniref:Glycoside hydrolase family 15 protein n=1 Tax=Rubrobacter marinus TaxID=2653852 RepID=A0A6G8PY24_9ACTN|nr:glycoside hydrolase family 15 protein [Rubrobacter marinus]QIN79090.1 glycoside hydrolase family 15 protein [Rubrobacter marinus]